MEDKEKKELNDIFEIEDKKEKPFILQDEQRFERKDIISQVKSKIGFIVVMVLLLICLLSVFSLFAGVSSIKENMEMLAKKIEDVQNIKAATTELDSKIEALKKENTALKAELTEVRNEIEKLKTQMTKSAQTQTQKQTRQVKPKRRL